MNRDDYGIYGILVAGVAFVIISFASFSPKEPHNILDFFDCIIELFTPEPASANAENKSVKLESEPKSDDRVTTPTTKPARPLVFTDKKGMVYEVHLPDIKIVRSEKDIPK